MCLLEKKGTTFKVIDNPMSAVKELIDNSIKAYSRTIKIKLDALSGGYKYIQICDDGLGIEKSKRHQVFLQEKLTTTKGRSIRRKSLFKIGNTALKHGSIEVVQEALQIRQHINGILQKVQSRMVSNFEMWCITEEQK